jgi:acyl dehydratase
MSPWKKTRLGDGHFITWADSYWNECKERVAEQRITVFAYGRGTGGEADLALDGGFSNSIEEAIEGKKTGYKPPPRKELCWEDVEEGDELPSIRMPMNTTRCVYLASATRDFSPQHTNPEYARTRSRTRDAFVNTQFNMGMVSRLATDWAGPTATVRRVKLKMKDNVCRGDDMILTGRVLRKYEQNGEYRVDIDVMISNQERPTTPCEICLVLPSRINAA